MSGWIATALNFILSLLGFVAAQEGYQAGKSSQKANDWEMEQTNVAKILDTKMAATSKFDLAGGMPNDAKYRD